MTIRTIAIGGLGAIGFTVAKALAEGRVPGMRLAAVSARDIARARSKLAPWTTKVVFCDLGDLAAQADIVIECAPVAVFDEVAVPAVEAGRTLIALSAGALLERGALIERAAETGAVIVVPSGAILGLDGIRAAAEGRIDSVTHITRKPPTSLTGAPYLTENGIDLDGLDAPRLIFKGSAREGARHFPANVNVSAAVSLAGIGPDRTSLELWADPALNRNTHEVQVEADSARFSIQVESLPVPGNPRTGALTPLSVLACLRGFATTLRTGS